MLQSAKLIGGAGTGKTTELLKIMEGIVGRGVSPEQIGFASFTRAARSEMVSRAAEAFNCQPSHLEKGGFFRTVHSTCYKQLDIKNADLLKGDNEATKWVADRLRVRVEWRKVEDSGYARVLGDAETAAALSMWDYARNRMIPLREAHSARSLAGLDVPPLGTICYWIKRYEEAKRVDGRVDYIDTLARFSGVRFTLDGIESVAPEGVEPEGVQAWIFDEAQDSSKLVHNVCLRLASAPSVKWAFLAADPFQSIFGFGGADYRNFLDWKADKERIMPQSFRCPAAVMALGERCLKRMRSGYFDRGIAPASHDGGVFREPSIEHALSRIDGSRRTLILARCNYSLVKFEAILTQRRIPHARITKSDETKATMAFNAYWKLQHGRGVSHDEWQAAVELTPQVSLGEVWLKRGSKAAWKRGDYERDVEFMAADEVVEVGGASPLLASAISSGEWPKLLDGGTKWYSVARRHGPEVATKPNVLLSTIHGAKGMEAEDVVLATESAGRIDRERQLDSAVHDEECRIEYVGVTRAKERLIVCESDEPYAMELPL
jgi:superfamily I DNA/RNA helicase